MIRLVRRYQYYDNDSTCVQAISIEEMVNSLRFGPLGHEHPLYDVGWHDPFVLDDTSMAYMGSC